MRKITTKVKLPSNIKAQLPRKINGKMSTKTPAKNEKFPEFSKLPVGGSFLVKELPTYRQERGAMYHASQKYGYVLIGRDTPKGARFWRAA